MVGLHRWYDEDIFRSPWIWERNEPVRAGPSDTDRTRWSGTPTRSLSRRSPHTRSLVPETGVVCQSVKPTTLRRPSRFADVSEPNKESDLGCCWRRRTSHAPPWFTRCSPKDRPVTAGLLPLHHHGLLSSTVVSGSGLSHSVEDELLRASDSGRERVRVVSVGTLVHTQCRDRTPPGSRSGGLPSGDKWGHQVGKNGDGKSPKVQEKGTSSSYSIRLRPLIHSVSS